MIGLILIIVGILSIVGIVIGLIMYYENLFWNFKKTKIASFIILFSYFITTISCIGLLFWMAV